MLIRPTHATYGEHEVEIANPTTGSGIESITVITDHRERIAIGTFPRQEPDEAWLAYYARCEAAAVAAWVAFYDPLTARALAGEA